jgi:hypothetical protein
MYNLKPPVATPREQAAEVARFHAKMIAQELRAAVKVAAVSQNPAMDLPKWAI